MISIITPTYNRGHLLGRMIKSVQQQSFKDWELIIVDDGSIDNTKDLVREFIDNKVKYFYSQHNGAAKSRNMGLGLANSEYIIFLDSDDEVRPNWLEKMWKELQSQKADIICCGYDRYNKENEKVTTVFPENIGSMFNGYNFVLSYISGTLLINKKIIADAGGFDATLASGQHTDLLIRLLPILTTVHIVNIFEPLVLIHEHGDNRIRKDFEALYAGCMGMIKKHKNFFMRNKNVYFDYLSMAGVNAMRTGRIKDARKLFLQAFKIQPYKGTSLLRLVISYIPYLNERFWRV